MNKTGYLKIKNNGEYFEIVKQKKQQGFMPYESNNSTSEYIEFQSMFQPILELSKFNYFIFNPSHSFVNREGKFRKEIIHEDFYKYAETKGFVTALEFLEEYNFQEYFSNKFMGRFRVYGEMIVDNQLFEFTMQATPYGYKEDMHTQEDFVEAQNLWNSLKKVKENVNKGCWIPLTLPKRKVLKSSKKHLDTVNDYQKKFKNPPKDFESNDSKEGVDLGDLFEQ